MNTVKIKQRRPIGAFIIAAVTLIGALACLSTLVSCHRHITKTIEGDSGGDGSDGKDGADGLDGLGFDYVRGIEGAKFNSGVVVMDSRDVVPAAALAWAPPGSYEGLTLTFGTANAPTRVYLADVAEGASCVIDLCGHGELGRIEAKQIALVPIEFALALGIVDRGVRVDFPGENQILSLIWHGRALLIGECVVITLGND